MGVCSSVTMILLNKVQQNMKRETNIYNKETETGDNSNEPLHRLELSIGLNHNMSFNAATLANNSMDNQSGN